MADRRLRRLVLVLCFAWFTPHTSNAQELFDGTPTCPECRFEFEPIVTLGSRGGDGAMPTLASAIRMDSLGRYIVLLIDEGLPFVFGPDGSFVQRIGRLGEGPGEFQRVFALEVTGDQIHLYDQSLGRLTSLDASFELLGTTQLPGTNVYQTLHLGGRRLVVNMVASDGTAVKYAVHFLGPDMEPYAVRDRYPGVFGDVTAHMRHLMLDDEGAVWTVSRFGPLQIRKYSADGDLLGTWSSGAESEARPFSIGDPSRDQPPTEEVRGAWIQDGLVWVLSRVPDHRWKNALEKVKGERGARYAPTNMLLLYDGLLEVFDPMSSSVVAARRVDASDAQRVLGGGLTAQDRSDDLGWIYIDVSRVRLVHVTKLGG